MPATAPPRHQRPEDPPRRGRRRSAARRADAPTAALLAALFAIAAPLVAADDTTLPPIAEVRFEPGATTTRLFGSIARGEQAFYRLDAAVGQELGIEILATESNAVFAVYEPDARLVRRDGQPAVRGDALPGVGPDDDATSWRGYLPASGSYLVVVGATRGGAEFVLDLALHSTADGCAAVTAQRAMDACWQRLAEEAEAARRAAARQLTERIAPDRRQALAAAEFTFDGYRDAHCSLVAAAYEGGSLARTAVATCRERLERERSAVLATLLADLQP